MQYRIEGPVLLATGGRFEKTEDGDVWVGSTHPFKREWKVLTASGDTVCVCFDPRDAERVCSALSMAS
jgi:hypothetical protein